MRSKRQLKLIAIATLADLASNAQDWLKNAAFPELSSEEFDTLLEIIHDYGDLLNDVILDSLRKSPLTDLPTNTTDT